MTIGIISMLIMVLFMVGGGLPLTDGTYVTAIFSTPTFFLITLFFCICLVISCIKIRKNVKNIPFILLHLSIVVIFIGAFIGQCFTIKSTFQMPIGQEYVIRQVTLPEDQSAQRSQMPFRSSPNDGLKELGFGISVDEFKIDYFPVDYDLFTMVKKKNQYGFEETDYPFVKTFSQDDGPIVVGEKTITFDELFNKETDSWKTQYKVDDVNMLQVSPLREKYYQANFRIFKDLEQTDYEDVKLAVNHPVEYGGWKFYLMSYDKQARRYLQITARRDPGAVLVVWGFWIMSVASVFLALKSLLQIRRANNE